MEQHEISEIESLRLALAQQLIDLCGTKTLPASVDYNVAASFLGLASKKTLSTWKSTKRHPQLLFLKTSYKRAEVCTASLIEFKISSVDC